jgi:hypothetical protein
MGLIQAFNLVDVVGREIENIELRPLYQDRLKGVLIATFILAPILISLLALSVKLSRDKSKTAVIIILLSVIIGVSVYFMFFAGAVKNFADYDGGGAYYPIYWYKSIDFAGFTFQQLLVETLRQVFGPIFIVAILGIVLTAINSKKQDNVIVKE